MLIRSFIPNSCLSAATLLSVPARVDDPIIKFSHFIGADTRKGKAAGKFRKLVEEHTHGRVRGEVYPDSTLYKDKEEFDALQMGSVQMLAPSIAKFAPL